ncbi:DUF3099 domain-containing protein [Actinomycetospora termitidis]|uniref:DUF3099 domain-containing protein n=1 Tax=Actinomycetospora termitidis TaxID=3053470 RepID=A0ABT7M755_9PSEU|nr:DUF3099 domain-containing protein [Actinomycetospora sp. Odt1-22]MDL5156504.1 DUF3099 domain-containing protein [Actinomycetospora sp. Odt1-22]
MKRPGQRNDDDPVLITEAAVSFEDEFAARKKRYSLIMACRIPCLILAGVFGIGFNWPLVAVAFIVLSVPLPWVAVLIANDRPPKKSQKVNRYRADRKALPEVSEARIIEAAEALDARSQRTDGPRQSRQDGPDHAPPRTGTDG